MPPLKSHPIQTSARGVLRTGGMLAVAIWLVSSAMAPAMAMPEQAPLRIGVERLPPQPGPSDFRLYTPEGFEALLAERIAGHMGRKLELIELAVPDEAAALARGDVEIVLVRRNETSASAVADTLVDAGFRSGLTAAMRTDTDIREWTDLAGRSVCVTRGNDEALALARQVGAQVQVEDSPARSLVLVRTGVCDAAIHDQVLLSKLVQETGWQKFSATLPVTRPTALVAAMRADGTLVEGVRLALSQVASPTEWDHLASKWARNVAFEVYLDQDAPDCH